MKNAALLLVIAFGLAFAGQIVDVGETFDGSSSTSGSGTPPADDSGCYNLHAQCLRDGCAAAHGTFSEQTQGCYGGDGPAFAKAVGECADAQGECVMGTGSGYSDSGSGAIVPIGGTTADGGASREGGLCPAGAALALALFPAYCFSRA